MIKTKCLTSSALASELVFTGFNIGAMSHSKDIVDTAKGNVHIMQSAIEHPPANLGQTEIARLFAATAEHAFEPILITTAGSGEAGYTIGYVNPAFTTMTGYGADEVIGKSPGILQGPKTNAAVLERLSSDLNAGRPFHGQAINYRKDGSEFMLEWKIIPVTDAQDSVTHLVSVQREIIT